MTTKAAKINQREIDQLQPKAKQYVEWDGSIPGLGIRVNPAGSKTYILKYRLKSGRVRWKSLGRVDAITLAHARSQATEDRGLVAAGKDPMTETDRVRGARTVAEVCQSFLDEFIKPKRAKNTLRSYTQTFESYIKPAFGSVPLIDLSSDDVEKKHAQLKATPIAANRMLSVLSKLSSWAKLDKNPTKGIERYPENEGERFLTPDEYALLGAAMRDAKKTGAYASAALTGIELAMLLGCRPVEVASLEWSFIDFKHNLITLPTSKTHGQTLALPAPAAKLLKAWPRFAESAYVFPGNGRRRKGLHMHTSTLTHTFQKLREDAGLPDDVTLYAACRHSWASVGLNDHNLSHSMIGKQLGHKNDSTTKRYTHIRDEVRQRNAELVAGTVAKSLKRKVKR